jgi:hypothetical protein
MSCSWMRAKRAMGPWIHGIGFLIQDDSILSELALKQVVFDKASLGALGFDPTLQTSQVHVQAVRGSRLARRSTLGSCRDNTRQWRGLIVRLNQIIDRLLQTGDVSIQYRVKREILGLSRGTAEMCELQAQIAETRKVTEVRSWPRELAGGEGRIGTELHGATGFDFGLEILLERGLETTHPILTAARDALVRPGDEYQDVPPGYSVLLAIDRAGRGGLRTMRAWLLALLGAEGEPIVAEETESALFHFRGLARLQSLDEVSTPYTGSRKNYAGFRVYRQGARFPGGWHHRLLAETSMWRTKGTLVLVANAFNNAATHFPIPPQILRRGSHYVGPGNIRWECLDWSDIRRLPELEFYFWLRHIVEIGKLEVVSKVPLFRRQVKQLRGLIEDDDWIAA